MSTEVTLTGTGMPGPVADRAGAGVLVRRGPLALQFDAGRATTMRLAALGVHPADLSALFVTHHHSDHLMGVADILISRWMRTPDPLVAVAPDGPATRFLETCLDVWADDLALRETMGDRFATTGPAARSFAASPAPQTVWQHEDVRVSAISVRHQPVEPAVAYRVDAPDGAVVISGDTVVCDEVATLAEGASVLVHEVVLRQLRSGDRTARAVAAYHADAQELGAMAARVGVPVLVLTHLIPQPRSDEEEQVFVDEVRRGGFEGRVVVGRDLFSLGLGEVRSTVT